MFVRVALAGLVLAGCTHPDVVVIDNTPKTCGVWTTDRYLIDSTSGLFGGVSGFATGVGNGLRVYSWTYQVREMCVSSTRSDNAVQFDVDFRADLPSSVTVSGFIYGSTTDGAEPTAVTTTRATGSTRVAYTGLVQDVDLAPASTDGKRADILIELEVSFPTTGTSPGDLAQLKAELLSIRLETFFHRYIGP